MQNQNQSNSEKILHLNEFKFKCMFYVCFFKNEKVQENSYRTAEKIKY